MDIVRFDHHAIEYIPKEAAALQRSPGDVRDHFLKCADPVCMKVTAVINPPGTWLSFRDASHEEFIPSYMDSIRRVRMLFSASKSHMRPKLSLRPRSRPVRTDTKGAHTALPYNGRGE